MTTGLRINVVPRAQRDIRDAVAWWRNHRRKAPRAVTQELRQAFRLLRTQPDLGARARSSALAGVRRIYLARIRYYLYYRPDPARSVVDILALWHASRGQAPEVA